MSIYKWQSSSALSEKMGVPHRTLSTSAMQRERGLDARFPVERRPRGPHGGYLYRIVKDEYEARQWEGKSGFHLAIYANQVEVHHGPSYSSSVATFWATAPGATIEDAEAMARRFMDMMNGDDDAPEPEDVEELRRQLYAMARDLDRWMTKALEAKRELSALKTAAEYWRNGGSESDKTTPVAEADSA